MEKCNQYFFRFVLTAAHTLYDTVDYQIRYVECFNLETCVGLMLKNLLQEVAFRCGDWDTQGTDEQFPYQERNVEEIILHPEFDLNIPVSESNFKNDVAVLKVEKPFILAPHIDTICLPPPNTNYDGRNCAATGWGKDRFGKPLKYFLILSYNLLILGSGGEYQTIMKEIWIDVIDHDTCQEKLRETRLGRFFELDRKSFICAGGESDKDMCTVSQSSLSL